MPKEKRYHADLTACISMERNEWYYHKAETDSIGTLVQHCLELYPNCTGVVVHIEPNKRENDK